MKLGRMQHVLQVGVGWEEGQQAAHQVSWWSSVCAASTEACPDVRPPPWRLWGVVR